MFAERAFCGWVARSALTPYLLPALCEWVARSAITPYLFRVARSASTPYLLRMDVSFVVCGFGLGWVGLGHGCGYTGCD